eukprot:s1028_g4.t1
MNLPKSSAKRLKAFRMKSQPAAGFSQSGDQVTSGDAQQDWSTGLGALRSATNVGRAASPPIQASGGYSMHSEVGRAASPPIQASGGYSMHSEVGRAASPPIQASGGYSMHSEKSALDLMECIHCGRNFNQQALKRHMVICQKVFLQKRKTFDVVQQRLADGAAPTAAPTDAAAGAEGKKGNWRQKSEAFRAAMKDARLAPFLGLRPIWVPSVFGRRRNGAPMAAMVKKLLAVMAVVVPYTEAASCPWTEDWEWEGVFHVHYGGVLTWIAQKVDGAYADATMKIVIRTTTGSSKSGLEAAESAALSDWNGNFTTVNNGDTLSPNNAYELVFDTTSWVTMFKINVPPETELAFFCQHFPSEFVSGGFNYLISEAGKVMTTAYNVSALTSCNEDSDAHSVNTDLIGEVVAASFVTTLPTLLGIGILLITCKGADQYAATFMHYSNAAASGVIFAVSVFLLMPESYLMMMGGKSESGAAAAWGSSVLAGWLIGIFVHQISHLLKKHPTAAEENAVTTELQPKKVDWSAAIPVFWGDFIHNISDGMVLGFAFYACGTDFAWKLAGGIIAHELPQELADFYVFINKAGMKWYTAVFLNFISSLSMVLGAVVAYYIDVSSEIRGAFLAIGAGVFLYVACTELGPQVAETHKGAEKRLLSSLGTIVMWILGAAVLGLVLLDHEHCYVPADPDTPAEDLHNGHAH